jgi:hypothetical protein
MKRASSARKLCSFCSASEERARAVCLNCSTTLEMPGDQTGESAGPLDLDATEQIGAYSPALYQRALQAQTSNKDERTELTPARSAGLYARAIQARENNEDERTRRVAAHSTTLYAQAIAKASDPADGDATERVARSPVDLYTQAVSRADSQVSTPSVEETEPVRAQPGQRRRTRRGFLAALHLFADLLLLLAFLSVGLLEYQQNAQVPQASTARLVQQQAIQYRTSFAHLLTQQQTGQARQEAWRLVMQFHQEALHWGKLHVYHDTYDGQRYALDGGYLSPGIGSLIDKDLVEARTAADFEAVSSEARYALFNLSMLEADASDSMPYNRVHTSDLRMLEHYGLQQKSVLLISLVEQALRLYQQGTLVRAFFITSGRFERPSLPGVWSVLDRQSPTIFEAGDPPGSPYWFPDTPINYALLYHLGGFFVHDAPWRATFGPGTQFPHRDARGNTPYNFDGSHGCINLAEADAAWVYHHTGWDTTIVIY